MEDIKIELNDDWLKSIYIKDYKGIKDLDLKIPESNFIFITGENGSGKSNLLEAIAERVKLICYEKDSTKKFYLNSLSTDEDTMLGIVFDIHALLSEYNSSIINEEDCEGIVLIDNIEKNLHPKLQYEFPYLLNKIFPKVQFIVTTNSPIPILGCPTDCSIITMNKENEINTGKLYNGIDVKRLTYMNLLTSPIFNFEHIHSRNSTPDLIYTKDNCDDILTDKELEENIKKLRDKGWL